MSTLDAAIIVVYFVVMIGIGVWQQRRASQNIENYFLGGNRIHWLALAMCGSVSTYDISGTMWMVALVYLFGMKSVWNHWMWGFMMAAFFMAYMGKWVRRSRVMTGAEWMITRFGDRADGRAARYAYALMAVVMLVGLISYAFEGVGKFSAEYVQTGLSPEANIRVLAIGLFAITTIYTLLGGLEAVVITHVLQTMILMTASVIIAGIAYQQLTPERLAAIAPVDGGSFTSLWPQWELSNFEALPASYQGYHMFGLLVMVWVSKGLLLNLGGPGQMFDFQMFLSTRDPRDAAKVGGAWSAFLIVRWAMVMGIALLAIAGGIEIMDSSGHVDAEIVMPKVFGRCLGSGMLGLVLAGLVAAFMSTFSATVNAGASYLVRDLWQPLFRPRADEKHLVRASYAATLAIVVVGTVIGMYASSIRQVWDWLMISLGAAFVIPNVLRWYWWRFNGAGYAAGTLVGLAGAMPLLFLSLAGGYEPPIYYSFPAICAISLIASLIGTYVSAPTENAVLVEFYRSVRPFGLWGPIKSQARLSADESNDPGESAWYAAFNVVVACFAIFGAYVAPMYLVGHWHMSALAWAAVSLVSIITLKFTWYDHLPRPE